MLVRIAKQFTFDAAHHLPQMPEGHKCRQLHGHTYRLEVQIVGRVHGIDGLVLDYADLAAAVRPVLEEVDHRNLNEIEGLANPTTEVLVAWLWKRLEPRFASPAFRLDRLRLSESSTTWAELERTVGLLRPAEDMLRTPGGA